MQVYWDLCSTAGSRKAGGQADGPPAEWRCLQDGYTHMHKHRADAFLRAPGTDQPCPGWFGTAHLRIPASPPAPSTSSQRPSSGEIPFPSSQMDWSSLSSIHRTQATLLTFAVTTAIRDSSASPSSSYPVTGDPPAMSPERNSSLQP